MTQGPRNHLIVSAAHAVTTDHNTGPTLTQIQEVVRGELRGTFEERVLTAIRNDFLRLEEKFYSLQQDVQCFAKPMQHKADKDPAGYWQIASQLSDPPPRPEKEAWKRNRDHGQNPSLNGSGGHHKAKTASAAEDNGSYHRSRTAPLKDLGQRNGQQKFVSHVKRPGIPHPHAIPDIDVDSISKEAHAPAPHCLGRPQTPADTAPALPLSVASPEVRNGLRRRSGSEKHPPETREERGDSLRKTGFVWDKDDERGASQESFLGAYTARPSKAASKASMHHRKSLSNGRVSLALARRSDSDPSDKVPFVDTLKSLTRLSTWKACTPSKILSSNRFDNVISILILGNAITIGAEADYAAKHVIDEAPVSYRVIEVFFCVVFTTELGLRLWVYKLNFLFRKDLTVLWNYFDLLVVTAQLVQEAISLMATSSIVDAGKLRVLRVLRVLRIVRILRLVRVLHLISELRTIVSSIMGSVRSLLWTVLLLLLMMYIVAVYFLQTVTDHLVSRKEFHSTDGVNEGDSSLMYHFGSLSQTILSLWQTISGGTDWGDLANPLISEVHPLLGLAFALYIAFALLALMNVVTGVFVQTALHSAEQEEDNFLTDQIIGLFHKCKGDPWGCITEKDLEMRLKDPATAKEWKNIDVSAEEAQYVFELLDVDECGEVQFEEFLGACVRLKGNAKSLDMLIQMQESRQAKRMFHLEFEKVMDRLTCMEAFFHDKLSWSLRPEAAVHLAPAVPDAHSVGTLAPSDAEEV